MLDNSRNKIFITLCFLIVIVLLALPVHADDYVIVRDETDTNEYGVTQVFVLESDVVRTEDTPTNTVRAYVDLSNRFTLRIHHSAVSSAEYSFVPCVQLINFDDETSDRTKVDEFCGDRQYFQGSESFEITGRFDVPQAYDTLRVNVFTTRDRGDDPSGGAGWDSGGTINIQHVNTESRSTSSQVTSTATSTQTSTQLEISGTSSPVNSELSPEQTSEDSGNRVAGCPKWVPPLFCHLNFIVGFTASVVAIILFILRLFY